jgi:hypothetical protein
MEDKACISKRRKNKDVSRSAYTYIFRIAQRCSGDTIERRKHRLFLLLVPHTPLLYTLVFVAPRHEPAGILEPTYRMRYSSVSAEGKSSRLVGDC